MGPTSMSDARLTHCNLHRRLDGLVSQDPARTLEDFLVVLWCRASPHRALTELPLTLFAEIIEAAFHDPPPARALPTTEPLGAGDYTLRGYARFEQTIRFQIQDLGVMAAAGTLTHPQRYFGIDAPRGSRWYNFDPATFLECGLAGAFGGYAESEAEPEPESIGWDDFADFLLSGQQYE